MTRRDSLPDLPETLPRHIAVIMDGNGRWAQTRGRQRTFGHRMGARTTRVIIEECARIGIERLTLYAFSAENWKRPKTEIDTLMKLLGRYLVRERSNLMRNNIRLQAIGRLDALPPDVRKRLARTIEMTAGNAGLTVSMALNYGGRAEIVDAARSLAREAKEGRLDPDAIDEDAFASRLYAEPGAPDPDILIRTGGDWRVSNFLLWQISYAEIFVTETPWPEFREPELHRILGGFGSRERRFGGLVQEEERSRR